LICKAFFCTAEFIRQKAKMKRCRINSAVRV
jgi:hypothetical protein